MIYRDIGIDEKIKYEKQFEILIKSKLSNQWFISLMLCYNFRIADEKTFYVYSVLLMLCFSIPHGLFHISKFLSDCPSASFFIVSLHSLLYNFLIL